MEQQLLIQAAASMQQEKVSGAEPLTIYLNLERWTTAGILPHRVRRKAKVLLATRETMTISEDDTTAVLLPMVVAAGMDIHRVAAVVLTQEIFQDGMATASQMFQRDPGQRHGTLNGRASHQTTVPVAEEADTAILPMTG